MKVSSALLSLSITNGQRNLLRGLLVLIAVGLGYSPLVSAAADPVVGVVYPNVREPYQGIFSTITDGIESELRSTSKHFIIDSDNPVVFKDWINREHIELVIALGKRSQQLIERSSVNLPVIYGALVAASNDEIRYGSGILLTPSPATLFTHLLDYAPGTHSVLVVYNTRHDQWLIDQASEAARALGLDLQALAAGSIQAAAQIWHQAIVNHGEERYAIWLLNDHTVVDSRAILPMILKESWERKIIAFSSNPSTVKRGVLFSLYPDNYNMGRSLGRLALQRLHSPDYPVILMPTEDVLAAFNTRTAEHLGIVVADEKMKDIKLTFPGN